MTSLSLLAGRTVVLVCLSCHPDRHHNNSPDNYWFVYLVIPTATTTIYQTITGLLILSSRLPLQQFTRLLLVCLSCHPDGHYNNSPDYYWFAYLVIPTATTTIHQTITGLFILSSRPPPQQFTRLLLVCLSCHPDHHHNNSPDYYWFVYLVIPTATSTIRQTITGLFILSSRRPLQQFTRLLLVCLSCHPDGHYNNHQTITGLFILSSSLPPRHFTREVLVCLSCHHLSPP